MPWAETGSEALRGVAANFVLQVGTAGGFLSAFLVSVVRGTGLDLTDLRRLFPGRRLCAFPLWIQGTTFQRLFNERLTEVE